MYRRDIGLYAVNDRPVKVVEFEDGSGDIFVFDWSTGGFVTDRSYWAHIHRENPFKDVDQLTKEQFDQLVGSMRASVVAKHVATPITWESDDGEGIFRAQVAGHIFTMRINNNGAGPRYTLLVDGDELADLEDWPSAWSRCGAQCPNT